VTETAPVGSHGAVDLSSLRDAASDAAGTVEEATEQNFGEVVERSRRQPVIVALWAEVSPASRDLVALLAKVATRYAGRLALVRCDVQRNPAIAEALQVYSAPAVVGFIAGRPAPLFQGVATEEQIVSVFDQVLEIAATAGIAGAEPPTARAEQEKDVPPPKHLEAIEAMERGDAASAIAAYERVLRDAPKDAEARTGLARARHFQRTEDADLAALIAAADAEPSNDDAAFAAADAEVAMGRAEAAFARLVERVRSSDGAARDRIRERLVELFDVVGIHDAAVADARRALASALY
jgi:putative thioredoxin